MDILFPVTAKAETTNSFDRIKVRALVYLFRGRGTLLLLPPSL